MYKFVADGAAKMTQALERLNPTKYFKTESVDLLKASEDFAERYAASRNIVQSEGGLVQKLTTAGVDDSYKFVAADLEQLQKMSGQSEQQFNQLLQLDEGMGTIMKDVTYNQAEKQVTQQMQQGVVNVAAAVQNRVASYGAGLKRGAIIGGVGAGVGLGLYAEGKYGAISNIVQGAYNVATLPFKSYQDGNRDLANSNVSTNNQVNHLVNDNFIYYYLRDNLNNTTTSQDTFQTWKNKIGNNVQLDLYGDHQAKGYWFPTNKAIAKTNNDLIQIWNSRVPFQTLSQKYIDMVTPQDLKAGLFYVDNNGKVSLKNNAAMNLPLETQNAFTILDGYAKKYQYDSEGESNYRTILGQIGPQQMHQQLSAQYGEDFSKLTQAISNANSSFTQPRLVSANLNTQTQTQQTVTFTPKEIFQPTKIMQPPTKSIVKDGDVNNFRVSQTAIATDYLNNQVPIQGLPNASTYLVPKDTLPRDLLPQTQLSSLNSPYYNNNNNLLQSLFHPTNYGGDTRLAADNFMGGDVSAGFSDFNLLSNINNPAYAESYRKSQQEVYNQSARFNVGVGQKGL